MADKEVVEDMTTDNTNNVANDIDGNGDRATDTTLQVFTLSVAFKEALATFAAKSKRSAADVVRQAVADVIGYDLSAEDRRSGGRKFANEAERKAAYAAERKAKAATMKRMQAEAEKATKLKGIKALEAYLLMRMGGGADQGSNDGE